MSDRNNGRSDDQMKCVYMGPPMKKSILASLRERFAGKGPGKKKPYPGSFADEKDPDDDLGRGLEEPELEEVYMGPPVPEEPEPETEAEPEPEPEAVPEPAPETDKPFDPSAVEGVYAGPDPSGIPPMAPVYAGPEMMNDPQITAAYAGPEMMSGPRMEALYAAPRRPDASRMMMVYAGPDYFAEKFTQTSMMMAYAGPAMDMSMTMAEKMAAAQKEAEEWYRKEHPGVDYSKEPQNPEDLGKETVCPGCGTKVLQARFCSECGAALPGSIMTKCPTCGSIVFKSKFCSECGAVFPKEEENASSPAEESGLKA
ncbi:MAG: zinc ribbon domain-containing protein [Lachnospiraceae bacterium]|nr:zinc ribbon domain-containing protein [Lachnospiraceae bacterium]